MKKIEILIIDDDELDRMSVKRMLKSENLDYSVVEVANGLEALEHLRSRPSFVTSIMLLDLNMPRMGGKEFLTALGNEPSLSKYKTFVYSTSDAERDVELAHSMNISGYFVKDGQLETMRAHMKLLGDYIKHTKLP